MLTAIRPDDLLALRFRFVNLALKGGKLLRQSRRAAYIVLELEPQHVVEEAFFERDDDYPITNPKDPDAGTAESDELPLPGVPVGHRIAARSRLVFKVPGSISEIPCTLAQILEACTRFPLVVAPTALPPPAQFVKGSKAPPAVRAPVAPPTGRETAIEAPWRLILSPNAYGAWLHATEPVVSPASGRVELWHSRLGIRGAANQPAARIHDGRYRYKPGGDGVWRVEGLNDEPVVENRTVRAIWSPDYVPRGTREHENEPFRMPLDARDRHELVKLTSNFRLSGARGRVVKTNELMVSAFGASLDLDYRADVNKVADKLLTIEAWRHLAALGKDHYVRVIYAGRLAAPGHAASLVKVTERKFERRKGATTAPTRSCGSACT